MWFLWKKIMSCMYESSLGELESIWTGKNQVVLLGFPKSNWEDPSPEVWKWVELLWRLHRCLDGWWLKGEMAEKFMCGNKLSFLMMESYKGLCWESLHFSIFVNAVEEGQTNEAKKLLTGLSYLGCCCWRVSHEGLQKDIAVLFVGWHRAISSSQMW